MKRKLLNRKGFTLAEALIATAVLAIFFSMTIVGTSSLFGTGEQMMNVSKAAVLGSDVMKAVTNEVRFGEGFSLQDGTLKYDSTTYGDSCEIKVNEKGQLTIVNTSSSANASGDSASDEKIFYPIGTVAYDEVYIQSMTFALSVSETHKDCQVISCTVSITSDGTNTLWSNTVTAVPLSQKTTV